jgi:hypothetical protein
VSATADLLVAVQLPARMLTSVQVRQLNVSQRCCGDASVCDVHQRLTTCTTGLVNCAGISSCPAEALCSNTNGSFTCTCTSGFSGDQCDDDDECTNGVAVCHEDASCTNDRGSFSCVCNQGFVGSGPTCEIDEYCVTGAKRCLGLLCWNSRATETSMGKLMVNAALVRHR